MGGERVTRRCVQTIAGDEINVMRFEQRARVPTRVLALEPNLHLPLTKRRWAGLPSMGDISWMGATRKLPAIVVYLLTWRRRAFCVARPPGPGPCSYVLATIIVYAYNFSYLFLDSLLKIKSMLHYVIDHHTTKSCRIKRVGSTCANQSFNVTKSINTHTHTHMLFISLSHAR